MGEKRLARAEIAFVLPMWNRFAYARRAALTFLKHTARPGIIIAVDDASPYYDQQNWVEWKSPARHADGSQDGVGIPDDQLIFKHFGENKGLTRSWNWGLTKAKELDIPYTICGNSDILFTDNWESALIHQLDHGYKLIGPVTNAPGPTNGGQQQVANFYPGYEVTDRADYLRKVAGYLQQHYPPNIVHPVNINGFFLMARTEDFWSGAYDKDHVFNPAKKMTGNEDELQGRWHKKGWKTGYAPGSFIFHYRAVSRGNQFKHQGWLRIDDINKPI